MSGQTCTLSLVNDEIHLTKNGENAVVVNNFSFAILEKDGRLSVAIGAGREKIFSDIVPNTVDLPTACKNLVYLGLQSQIVIVSLKEVEKFFHLATSTDSALAIEWSKLVPAKALRADQDVLCIVFKNGCSVPIYAHKKDCLAFVIVLSEQKMRFKSDGGKFTLVPLAVNDVEATLGDNHAAQVSLKLYSSPLSFGCES